jgi:long-chain acyl-CoA synthetase
MKPTAIQALTHQAQVRPRSPAFLFHGEAWTYEKIASQSKILAHGMAARGVRPGDRVALHMMNRPEFIIAYYACFRIGAIAAPLRTAFKLAELAPLLGRLKPALYIGETELYDNVEPIDVSMLPKDRRFIVGATVNEDEVLPWEKLFEGATSDGSLFSPAADLPAVLITTSGTTSEPKFVVHTAATLAESTELWIQDLGLSSDDIIAEPLPLAHMSGLITSLSYVQSGAPFVLLDSFDADTVLDTIERHRCSLHVGFPAQYAALLNSQRARPRNLSALRFCLTGGDACPIDLQQQVTSAFNAPLYNIWAATEAIGNLNYGLRSGQVTRIVKDARIRRGSQFRAVTRRRMPTTAQLCKGPRL